MSIERDRRRYPIPLGAEVLADVRRIEASYWRSVVQLQREYDRYKATLHKQLVEQLENLRREKSDLSAELCFRAHQPATNHMRELVFSLSYDFGDGELYGIKWRPATGLGEIMHGELGPKVFAWRDRHEQLQGRVLFLRETLSTSWSDWLVFRAPKAIPYKILRVAINGRKYLFRGVRKATVQWEKLHWPSDAEFIDVTIDSDKGGWF